MYGGVTPGRTTKRIKPIEVITDQKIAVRGPIFRIVINKRQEQQDDRYCMRQKYFLEAFCNFLQNGNMGKRVEPRLNRGKNGRKNLGFKR